MLLFLESIWAHVCIFYNKKEDILILGIGLDDTMLTAEAYYSISFSRSIEHFV